MIIIISLLGGALLSLLLLYTRWLVRPVQVAELLGTYQADYQNIRENLKLLKDNRYYHQVWIGNDKYYSYWGTWKVPPGQNDITTNYVDFYNFVTPIGSINGACATNPHHASSKGLPSTFAWFRLPKVISVTEDCGQIFHRQ